MALYRYTKNTEKSFKTTKQDFIILENGTKEDVNLWNSIGHGYGAVQNLVNKSKAANLIIPSILILTGIFFIAKQFLPEIQTWAQKQTGILNQGTTSPVADQFIDYSKYISNPAGLDRVSKEAFSQNILQQDTTSINYRGIFYISIPAIGINHLPVQANVDSTNEAIYNAVLTNSLAHFRNTGLPISNVNNNTVIYGHSASATINPKPTNPEVAFTFLPNLKVGDNIFIEMDGKKYEYKMYKSKIVSPTDTSVITGTRNKRELTLISCWPAGADEDRYVALARPV